MLAYARKVFRLERALALVTDSRSQPRIPTLLVAKTVIAMFLGRLGSLNALEQTGSSVLWSRYIGGALPSADSIGRICAVMSLDSLRQVNRELYSQLKRNKALEAPDHGLMALVIDGHESSASYRRCCPGCLKRRRQTKNGERIQFYHRNVTAMLVTKFTEVFLDSEAQLAGEDEIATAIRLFERVADAYPRAYDVVMGDALYSDSRFFKSVLGRGKHVLSVLKDDRRDLLRDAKSLFSLSDPEVLRDDLSRRIECWDAEGFTSWPQVSRPVRVTRTVETRRERRQLDGNTTETVSNWFWVTSLPQEMASSRTVVSLGHARWKIENEGFNETTTRWHADHVYKHDPNAIEVFWLLCMIAFNVFRVFYRRNLKPAVRDLHTMAHIAEQMSSEIYAMIPAAPVRPG